MITFSKGFSVQSGLKSNVIKLWIKSELQKEQKQWQHIHIHLCSDDELLQINQTYLKHTYYTDIITFDYSESNLISGELFISNDRVIENAIHHNIEVSQEYARVIIHGILHLCGYTDNTTQFQLQMRKRENSALKRLNKSYI